MNVSLRRAVALIGLAGAFAAAMPVSSARTTCGEGEDGGAQAVAHFCRRTTIVASSAGAIEVVLSEPATLSVPSVGRWRFNTPNSHVWLDGGGRFAGFVLQRLERNEPVAAIFGGRVGGSRGWDFFHHSRFESSPAGVTLPAGTYRIILASDRRPLALTIDLPTLEGIARYSAYEPVTNRVFTDRLSDPLGGNKGVYSFGLDGPPLDSKSLGIAAIWGTASRHVAAASGACFYGSGGVVAEERQYLPGCPSRGSSIGESHRTFVAAPPGDRLVSHLHVAHGLSPGAWGIGAWMTAEHGLANVNIALIWIGLD